MKRKWLLLFFGLLTCLEAPSKEPVLRFEPVVSTLTGTLETRVFPGPPNYESIKNGDAVEGQFTLRLERPISVLYDGKEGESFNETETNVKAIQLVVSKDRDFEILRKLINRKISATGTLFHAHTGHHHLEILMEIGKFHAMK